MEINFWHYNTSLIHILILISTQFHSQCDRTRQLVWMHPSLAFMSLTVAVCTLADALFYNLNTDVTESISHVIQATLRQLLIRFSLP